jgi:hypothetical protein
MEESAKVYLPVSSITEVRCPRRGVSSYHAGWITAPQWSCCLLSRKKIGFIMRYMLEEPYGAAVELLLFTDVVNTAEFMKLVLSGELDVGALDAIMVSFRAASSAVVAHFRSEFVPLLTFVLGLFTPSADSRCVSSTRRSSKCSEEA